MNVSSRGCNIGGYCCEKKLELIYQNNKIKVLVYLSIYFFFNDGTKFEFTGFIYLNLNYYCVSSFFFFNKSEIGDQMVIKYWS